MTDEEYKAHFSIWAAMKSPMIMTNVLSKLDPATLSILQNTAVLAVSQDSLGSSATRRWRYFVNDTDSFGQGEIQLFTGGLSGGDELVLFLNAGSREREMNATLAEIFWANGASGTAPQVKESWDIFDLWAGRQSNATASSIISGNITIPLNMTSVYGNPRLGYAKTPLANDTRLMGSKIGSVSGSEAVRVRVKPHGVAMLRLRQRSNDSPERDEL